MFVKGRFSTDFFDHFEYNRPCGLSNWRSLRAALLFCVLALIFCGATAIICPLTEYGGVLKWSKRRDSKSRRPVTGCKGSNPFSSARKEPLLLLSESRGSNIIWRKYKHYLRNKGVVPTPVCQLFQIHGSIFQPDPSCDCGQTSVVCISHCVLLFCIRKDSFNRLFALCIDFLCTLCSADLFYKIQILLPNVSCEYFLSFFIGPASCSAGAVPTFLRCASVNPFSIPVSGSMS